MRQVARYVGDPFEEMERTIQRCLVLASERGIPVEVTFIRKVRRMVVISPDHKSPHDVCQAIVDQLSRQGENVLSYFLHQ